MSSCHGMHVLTASFAGIKAYLYEDKHLLVKTNRGLRRLYCLRAEAVEMIILWIKNCL